MDKTLKFIAIGLITGIAVGGFISYAGAVSSFNPTINYEGKLTDANGVAVADSPAGTPDKCLEFSIYSAQTNGNLLWGPEVWDGSTSKISTTSGDFSIALGTHVPFTNIFNGSSLWLEIAYEPGCTGGYTEVFSPRKQLGAVPAAFQSAQLEGATWESAPAINGLTLTSQSTGFTIAGGTSTSKTLTLGGNFTTAHGDDLTLTTTGSTNVTLPTSGTLDSYPTTQSSSYNSILLGGSGNATTTGVNLTSAGHQALQADTSGGHNSAYGYQSMYSTTSGGYNTAFGDSTLYHITTVNDNTAFGYGALYDNTAAGNTAFGSNALFNNSSAGYNTAIGYYALVANTTGGSNTAIGHSTLYSNIGGSNNTALGYNAGYNASPTLDIINNSTFVGYQATSNADNITNSMALGYNAQVTASNQVVIGNSSVTQTLLNGEVGIGTTSPGAQLQINPASASTAGLLINSPASPTANLLDIQVNGTDKLTYLNNGLNSTFTMYGNTSGNELLIGPPDNTYSAGYVTASSNGLMLTAHGGTSYGISINYIDNHNILLASNQDWQHGNSTNLILSGSSYQSNPGGNLYLRGGTSAAGVGSYGLIQFQDPTGASNYLTVLPTGNIGIANTSPGALLDLGLAGTTPGVMRFEGATSGYAALQATAAAGNVTLTLPATTGTLALTSNIPSSLWTETPVTGHGNNLAPATNTDRVLIGNGVTDDNTSALQVFGASTKAAININNGTQTLNSDGSIGVGASAGGFTGTNVIGAGLTATANNQVVLGANSTPYLTMDGTLANFGSQAGTFGGAGGITLGTQTTTNIPGYIKFIAAGSNTAYSTSFTAGTQTANLAYTLPTAYGTGSSNYVLTDASGNGTLSWAAASASTLDQVLTAGSTSASNNLTLTAGTLTAANVKATSKLGILGTAVGGAGTISYALVAGGGGGGGGWGSGGGGAGGLVYNLSYSVTAQTYAITVGSGGSGGSGVNNSGSNGNNSTIVPTSGTTITAVGGGGGGFGGSGSTPAGSNGGSGGGGGGEDGSSSAGGGTGTQPGSTSGGYGHNGGANYQGGAPYSGGGGGGGGGNGINGSVTAGGSTTSGGGVGILNPITGSGYLAGGGGSGGTTDGHANGGAGGNGGGGAGGVSDNTGGSKNGTNGTPNTGGGGGGGGGASSSVGGTGGSGIAIVSFPTGSITAHATGTYSFNQSGGNDIYTFTGGGNFIVDSISTSNNYTYFQGGANTSTITYTLPAALGTGSSNYVLTDAAGNGNLTWVAAPTYPTGTIVGTSDSQALTNKTITSSTNKLGGVTMNLGSDAVGDLYYGGASNVLTRLADVAAGQPLLSGGTTTAPGYAGYTFSGTAGQTYTFPTTTATLARTDAGNTFTGHQTIEGVTSTGATGTGNLVFGTTPTFTTSLISPEVDGSVSANGILTLQGTTNATRTTSYINLQPNGGNVGIGTTSPSALLSVGSGSPFTVDSSGNVFTPDIKISGSGIASVINYSSPPTVTGSLTYTGARGAALANLMDNSLTTYSADPAGGNANTNWGAIFASAVDVTTVMVWKDPVGGFDYDMVMKWQYSDDGSNWTQSGSNFTLHAGFSINPETYTFPDNGSHKYWRAYYVSGTTGGNYWLQEVRLYNSSGTATGNITYSSNAFSFDSPIISTGGITTKYSTSDPSLSTNGQIAVSYEGSAARIRFVANGTEYYIDKTGGFGIPANETIDPISGDKMQIGDIVMGMVNQNLGDGDTPEDSSLHGVWVKWDSVKAQLLAEARGELSKDGTWGTGSVAGVSTTTLADRVTNVLIGLGISIKNDITNIPTLSSQQFTATTATINRLQMVDSATGAIYCTWIENGEWQKVQGNCADVAPALLTTTPIAPTPSSEPVTAPLNSGGSSGSSSTPTQTLNISSAAPISDINVDYGTAVSSANLPTTVTATLSDSTTQTIGVTWDNGTPTYNPNTAGTYVFSGTLNLPENISNTNNLTATVNVIVAAQAISSQAPSPDLSQTTSPSDSSPTDDVLQNAGANLLNGILNFVKLALQTFYSKILSFSRVL